MTELLNPGDGPAQFEQRLRRIEAQLAAMSTARSAPVTSVADGAITVIDENGDTVALIGEGPTGNRQIAVYDPATGGSVAVLGQLTVNTTNPVGSEIDVGLLVQDENGVDLFVATRTHGLHRPVQQFEWREVNVFTAVTSGTFDTQYQSVVTWLPTTAVKVDVAVGTDAGTTGEVRLQINHGGTLYNSSAISVPAASAPDYRTFKMDLDGLSVPIGTTFFANVQARRTGGAGNVNVFEPLPLRTWDTAINGADTDGIYP